MRRVLLVFGAWTAVALLFAIQMHYQVIQGSSRPWRWIMAWQLSGWWSWALFTAPVWAFAAWAVRIRRPAAIIAAHLPMALLIGVSCAAFEGAVKGAFGLYLTPHTVITGAADAVQMYWTFNLLVYAMVAGLYHAWRASRLETQLVQARLDALVAQLQPHFLFNTLHTISAFVLEDPKQANRMITRLSELLRQSFNRERGPLVTLDEELELLDHYVAIQEARFGDRLRVTFRVDPRAASAVVPTLLLQPLVENAIRHGAAPHGGVADVEIAATRAGDRLHLEVRDNGPGLAAGNGGGGGAVRAGDSVSRTRGRGCWSCTGRVIGSISSTRRRPARARLRRSRFPSAIMRAIIVDDEAPARRRLRGVLQQIPAVTRIDECASGHDAVELLKRAAPDLIFLDIQMPDLDGFAVAAAASQERPPAIVFVTAYEEHAVRAFEIQAFDYLLKPFDDERVIGTVQRASEFLDWIRREGDGDATLHGFGDVTVDFATHQVRRAGRTAELRPKEYALLVALLRRGGRVASRLELLHEVWGYAEDVMSRTVDTHVAMLRRKLERDPAHPRHIVTVRTFGYRIER